MPYLLVLSLFLFFSSHAQGQLTAPCARVLFGLGQDSVVWQGSPCPNFGGYLIETQVPGAGGWTRLDTVFDQGYRANNPGEEERLYRIGMLCNGQEAFWTIAVENARPQTPDLYQVSIINGQPLVSWTPSPSPGVIGYQLYKEQPYGSGNFFPYPRIGDLVRDTFFVDANSTETLVRYAIVAETPCNKGLLGEGGIDGTTGPHSSIALGSQADACARSLQLNWNAYENWREGVLRYEIWRSLDGGAFTLYDSSQTISYLVEDIRNGQNLRFYVRAIERGREINAAQSTIIEENVQVNRPIDFLRLEAISAQPLGGIEIHWAWDDDADFVSASLEVAREGQDYQSIQSFSDQSQLSFLDLGREADEQPWFYRLRTEDACGQVQTTSLAHSLVLLGETQEGFINSLSWQQWAWQEGQPELYELYRIEANTGAEELINRSLWGEEQFEERVNLRNPNRAKSCYYVQALVNFPARDGLSAASRWIRSNTVCLEQESLLHFPNALAPEGRNRIFRPASVFASNLASYELHIFNRQGLLLFRSNEVQTGWDGRYQGELCQGGVYVYQVRYKTAEGKEEQLRGTLVLIR